MQRRSSSRGSRWVAKNEPLPKFLKNYCCAVPLFLEYPNVALALRVPAIVTNELLTFVRDVLREFGQKIQCAENLEVAPPTAFQVAAGRTGETSAASLLGAVDNPTVVGQANHPGQTEGAAQDVLGQPLQSRRNV